MQTVATLIAIALAIVAYVPYLRDTIRGRTEPHAFSWFVWATVTLLVAFFQLRGGGGGGAVVTLIVGMLCVLVFTSAVFQGKQDIKRIDAICLAASLSAIPLWIITNDALLSVILLSVTDVFAFAPTVRKSWNKPDTETLSTYVLSTIRHAVAMVALSERNVVTVLFPATWMVINMGFSWMLIHRRWIVRNQHKRKSPFLLDNKPIHGEATLWRSGAISHMGDSTVTSRLFLRFLHNNAVRPMSL